MSPDFTFITKHLATGAAIQSDDDVNQLVAAGITHVLDCRDDFDDASLLASHPSIVYSWNGTPDDGVHPKPVSWFAKGIAFAIPALSVVGTPQVTASTITVPTAGVVLTASTPHPCLYCHCAAGVNRGPSMTFAIMLALDWPADVAEARIRQERPQVGLAYRDDAIAALGTMGY